MSDLYWCTVFDLFS